MLEHIANEIEIDAEIVMDESITHAGHRAPLDIWMLCADFARNALCSLADDFETPNDRALHGWIIFKLLACHARADREEVITLDHDMPEKLTRLE